MRMQKRPHTRPLTMLSDLAAGVVGLHTPHVRGRGCDNASPVWRPLPGPRWRPPHRRTRRQLAAASGSVADAGAVSGGAESVPA